MKTLLVCILILPTLIVSKETNYCKSRDYGNDGTVCVCDAKFCDTIERYNETELKDSRFIKYTSNKDGLRFAKEYGKFHRKTNNNTAVENAIHINSKEEYQNIVGWGGAFTDSFGYNAMSLDETARTHLLNSYFSDSGLQYSLCRVPIGGTDFSLRAYSYDDGDVADVALKRFNLTGEDYDYKIPLIRIALNLTGNKLRLFASAWTAPKWMKATALFNIVNNYLRPEMYESWARYHLKFLQDYSKEGIKFWGVTTGNEPSLGLVPFNRIPSVSWLPHQMIEYVSKHLGPILRNSSFKDIKVLALDDQRFFLPWYIDRVFSDQLARDFIDGISVHWYYDNLVFPPSLLTKTHNQWPDKFILAAEACNGNRPLDKKVILGSWQRGESYAIDIIEDLQNWVVGWIDWNMALDLTGGPTYINNNVDSPIIVNLTSNEFYKQPTFYVLGHFSKFISPNSKRIYSSSFDKEIQVVAFKTPDKHRVVVILNMKMETVQVTLIDDLVGLTNLKLTQKSITTIIY